MKKAIIALATAAALTGCASTPQAAPAPAPVVTQDDTLVNNSQDTMLSSIRSMSPDFKSVDNSLIISTVNDICTSLSQGYTGSDIASIADGNIGRDNATTLVAAAIVYVCPQYESLAIQ